MDKDKALLLALTIINNTTEIVKLLVLQKYFEVGVALEAGRHKIDIISRMTDEQCKEELLKIAKS